MTGQRRRLVALAFAVGMLIWSVGLFGPAAILPYLQGLHGWSVSVISAAITIHFLVSALVVAAMPEVHRKLGLRATVLAGVLAVYARFTAWVTVPLPHFLFVAAVLGGCGLACGAPLPSTPSSARDLRANAQTRLELLSTGPPLAGFCSCGC